VAKVFSTRKKKFLFCSVCSRTTQLNTHTKKKKTGICNKINIDAHWLKETKKKEKKRCQYLPSLPFVEGRPRVGEEARQSAAAAEAATSPAVGSASQVERRSVNSPTHHTQRR
jgi:hypothetical protein